MCAESRCEGEEEKEIRRKTAFGMPRGMRGSDATTCEARGGKKYRSKFYPSRVPPAVATALFILSTVHLTLKCAPTILLHSRPISRSHSPVAFSPSRLLAYLVIYFFPSREELPRFLSPLIIVILPRRPFSSSYTTGF